jgi:hypothetical protein
MSAPEWWWRLVGVKHVCSLSFFLFQMSELYLKRLQRATFFPARPAPREHRQTTHANKKKQADVNVQQHRTRYSPSSGSMLP